MKITCQSCQSKYNVADEKVQGKIVKIRCRKCGATIVVQGNGSATTNGSGAAAGPAGAAEGDGQWHVNVGEGDPRTMSITELVEAYNAGVVGQDTFIWTDGMDDWKPLSEVEAVVSALHAGAGAAPAVAEPAYTPPVVIAPEPAPIAAMAAPVAVPVAAEPRRAAVAKRDARGARDLFGGGVGGEEVQTSAPVVPQMMASGGLDDASKMTGQRNENSVLFSLAVLTKDAGERPEESAPKPTGKNSDDSGLIDLKALAAKAESMRPAAGGDNNAFASPLGLGAPPLGGLGVLGSPLGEAPPKSKLPLYIGGGAGVVLLLILGIVIGVKVAGGGAAPEASAMASTAPTVAATATAEPSATASAPTADATASAAPSASVAAKPKAPSGGGTYHPPSGGAAKPAGGATTAAAGGTATAAPTPPPPKKAGSDCGCNGDLMCLMKCSTH
jgi:predicted Zn finger-like uncharacterized protein